ncbi:hypothetical protein F4861DRAFT_540782 [Xylaria intraflava]|nr:hypothetical protein F4861DRAFT_540782 [Xylaria intraflava]
MSTVESKPAVYATVSALDAGHITLRDALYVTGADPDAYTTVPSLSFLIRHPSPPASRNGNTTNVVFDLGVKRNISDYAPGLRQSLAQMGLITTQPDCSASLRHGAVDSSNDNDREDRTEKKELLTPEQDVDFVILSHVHWDHIGTPSDFARATFVVGSGSLQLLKHGAAPYNPPDEFNADELPLSRTVELPLAHDFKGGDEGEFREYYAGTQTPAPTRTPTSIDALPGAGVGGQTLAWRPFAGFPAAIDFFGDGSVYIIDCPGHIYGHINLLVRTAPAKYVYLGADCCHDNRILTGERDFAEYEDKQGRIRSAHVHTRLARESLRRINESVGSLRRDADVEIIIAHDKAWRERNRSRFWPGTF